MMVGEGVLPTKHTTVPISNNSENDRSSNSNSTNATTRMNVTVADSGKVNTDIVADLFLL